MLFPAGMKANNPNIKTDKGDGAVPDPRKSGTSNQSPSLSSEHPANGGQTTISPPANVKTCNPDQYEIVAHGIDSLYLSIDVKWKSDDLFLYLGKIKQFAKNEKTERTVVLFTENGEEWPLNIKPYGMKGYEWFLTGNDYTIQIGDWIEPQSRPSIYAKISSEALWRLSPENAVEILLSLLKGSDGEIICVKPSRADLCVDILLPESIWNQELINYRVTRASYDSMHRSNGNLTGISIGKGVISARLYDKPLEINQKSKKIWMFDIWGFDAVPENMKVIRVEFQLRREGIKELGLDDVTDLFKFQENVWAYCTKQWLKFQDNPGKHHTQRKTFQWWEMVQDGFQGNQEACPLIRNKAFNPKIKQSTAQAKGNLTSLQALILEEQGRELSEPADLKNILKTAYKEIIQTESDETISSEVINKRAKYHRSIIKNKEVNEQRKERGFPTGSIGKRN